MKKINIKQIENIAKVFTVLTWLAMLLISLNINDTYNDVMVVISGAIMFVGFGVSLPLYVLTRFYNHIVDTSPNK